MATSKVEIANIALVGLRASTINSFTDETAEAIAVNVIWDNVRASELSKHPYNFAMKRASLPRLAEAPAFGYTYQFQLPVDCLRVHEAINNMDFKIEGDKLLTNAEEVDIKYIFDNTDISTWTPSFKDLVAARLRIDLAYTLAADKEIIKLSQELYERKSREVKWIDASEDIPDSFGRTQSNLIGVRY